MEDLHAFHKSLDNRNGFPLLSATSVLRQASSNVTAAGSSSHATATPTVTAELTRAAVFKWTGFHYFHTHRVRLAIRAHDQCPDLSRTPIPCPVSKEAWATSKIAWDSMSDAEQLHLNNLAATPSSFALATLAGELFNAACLPLDNTPTAHCARNHSLPHPFGVDPTTTTCVGTGVTFDAPSELVPSSTMDDAWHAATTATPTSVAESLPPGSSKALSSQWRHRPGVDVAHQQVTGHTVPCARFIAHHVTSTSV